MMQTVAVKRLWMLSVVCAFGLALFPQLLLAQQMGGPQLRILDASGLIRATKVVAESGNITISLDTAESVQGGECVATNLDGLAAERRVRISPNSECSFEKLSAGSWQVKVPGATHWRARIYE